MLCKNTRKYKTILSFMKPYKWKFALLFICILATTFLGALYPYVFGKLIDEVILADNMNRFVTIFLMYGLIFIVCQMLYFLLNMLSAHLTTRYLFDVRKAIMKKVLSYPGSALANLSSGDIIYRMGHDTEQFMSFIFLNVFYLIASAFYFILTIFFVSKLSIYLALIILVIAPLSVYSSLIFSKRIKEKQRSISQKAGLLTSWLFEIIKGMQEIKVLASSDHVLNEFAKKNISIANKQIAFNKIKLFSERISSGVSLIAQLTLYSLSAFFILNGSLTLGGFTASVAYFRKALSSFSDFNKYIIGFSAGSIGIERVTEILGAPSETSCKNRGNDITISDGNIEFRNVTFKYGRENIGLDAISFNIKPREITAIVGYSGVGKSTILNLILGFYEVHSGNILIDNHNISEFQLQNLRKQLGVVYQDTILFEGTIRYNLDFYNTYTDEEIFDSLKKANLYEWVMSLSDGIYTIIGKNGVAMSGGQKQRLAIARVILKDSKILMFDEATSSIDSESEQVIKDSLELLRTNKTIIIIAHRLSTIINSDKILVLDNGKIVGCDTHQNLISTCDVYKQLFKDQCVL